MKDNLIRLAKYVYYFLPDSIKRQIVKKKQKRDLRAAHERIKRTKVTREEVKKIIDSLNIGTNDVILHSSLLSIGKVQGGVKWVTNCLFEKINLTSNTLLVSALPYRGKFKDYLENIDVFDVRKAPIEMGGINEYIGQLPESKRSVHPTHSIVAIGKNAEEYVCGHHLDCTPFGLNSPYYKIIKNHGKAVMFGASWNYFTSIHVIEDLLGKDYPGKIYAPTKYKVKCFDSKGNQVIVETPYHDSLNSCIRMMSPLKPKLLKKGIMEVTPIGESEIEIIDMYKFALFYLDEIKNGRTIYGHVKVSEELMNLIEEIKKSL